MVISIIVVTFSHIIVITLVVIMIVSIVYMIVVRGINYYNVFRVNMNEVIFLLEVLSW